MLFKGKNTLTKGHSKNLPREIIFFIISACLILSALGPLGFNFGVYEFSPQTKSTLEFKERYYFLSGEFLHIILEWSGIVIAMLTAVLSFVHYLIKRDPVAPIICLAFLCGHDGYVSSLY